MNKLKIGIIGIGNMGSVHASNIFEGKIENMELTALCDNDYQKYDWAIKNFPNVKVFNSYDELLNSGIIQAVLIATPHYLHPVIAIKAFEKGLHVLTEKPAGVYTNQVKKMNEAALKSGKIFGIMFNQRTNLIFQKARMLVQNKELGEPKRFNWIITNWYRTQEYYDSGSWRATWASEGGGVLLNQAPHNLDLWQWIFGMPKRIRAFCSFGKYHNIEVEDDVTIFAEYENGATANFITTTGEFPGTNRLEISGDKGKIVIEDKKLKFWSLSIPEREFCFDKNLSNKVNVNYQEYIPNEPQSGHNEILKNFADAVLHNKQLLAPGIEGLNQLEISNAAYLSQWNDDFVKLPIDGDLFEQKLNALCKKSAIKNNNSFNEKTHGNYKNKWDVNW